MARDLEARDLQYLRLLAGQIARDAQALHDAIPDAVSRDAYMAACDEITPAIANLGELVHQWCLFWEDATPQERRGCRVGRESRKRRDHA
jgi:hypothetical protein